MSSNFVESNDHSRTIIHVDLDCFYAQVEMLKNPTLRTKPLGIQQKNIVVTSNYIAREYGIKKCMLVSEALKLCPQLVLVKGEDLYDYRQMSAKVSVCIQKFANCVEKLGLDENFIDVTELVKNREETNVVGKIFNGEVKEECLCGCIERLSIGSTIALEIRKAIKDELGLTSCAGIAHNKLLAKLVGAVNKPDQQTIVYPSRASELMSTLPSVRSIPGIGTTTYEIFKSADLKTVQDVRNYPFDNLVELFGAEKAKIYLDLCYGIDNSIVKQSGRPQSIGLEDSCRTITIEGEVQEKFRQLLRRLMILVSEDGRVPRTIKATLRKFDTQKRTSHREQRQCNISPSLFNVTGNNIKLTPENEDKLMTSVMHLFHKMVNISQPFHITLFGLAFTKFQEKLEGKSSIVSYLMKDVSVHSVTNVQNTPNLNSPRHRMDYSPISAHSDLTTDGSESELEPSPKKVKLGKLFAKRRCLDTSPDSGASPSKLRVAELRLNSRDSDNGTIYPDNVDPNVFQELPVDVQNELLQQWKVQKTVNCTPVTKPKTNTLLNYLIRNKQ